MNHTLIANLPCLPKECLTTNFFFTYAWLYIRKIKTIMFINVWKITTKVCKWYYNIALDWEI